MADVYLAVPQGREPTWQDALVVKRLKPDLVFDSEYRGMFRDEAKLALKLDHPNIVAATEMGDVDGQPYLAMEFLQGLPVDKILEAADKERLTRGEILRVMSDLLKGMHHAHELKGDDGEPLEIVHRDVSPHNVFVTYDGRVKLVDFGIAKSRDKAQHTSTGVVKGKIAYMAPEQALCSVVDKRADVFAAGVILWELITGKRFWGELSDLQILKTMTFGELPQLEDHLPNASPELLAICAKALAITPDVRYPSAAEFRDDVDRFIERLGEKVSAEELGQAVARVAGDNRRALDQAIEQQFGRRSLIVRDDTPLNVEVPIDDLPAAAQAGSRAETDIARTEGSPSARKGRGDPSGIGPTSRDAEPSSQSGKPSALDPVSASELGRVLEEGALSNYRAPAPTWQAPARKPSVWPWMALGGAVALGVAVIGFRGLSTANDPSQRSSPDLRESSASRDTAPVGSNLGAGPAVAQSSAPKAPYGDLVSVHIAVSPSDAKVRLDGTLLADNPFSAKFKKDGVAHTLSVESPGYRSLSQMLVFDRDIEIKTALDPMAGGVRHPPTPGSSSPPSTSSGVVDPSDPWAKKKPKKPSPAKPRGHE